MERKFIAYMEDVIKSVGLEVSETGEIKTSTGKNLKTEGKILVLPSDDNINNMTEIVDNQLVEKHKIFNPFSEDEIKRNYMLVELSRYMSNMSTAGIGGIIQQLLLLLEDEQMQDKMHTSIQKFIVQLREKLGNKGKLATKRTFSSFTKLVSYSVENNLPFISYKIARGETINGIKYIRTAKLDTKLIDLMKSKELELDIPDRDKDIFNVMIEFIMPDINDIIAGSKSKRYPSYIALYDLYSEVQGRINFLLKELKDVAAAPYEVLYVNIVDEDIEKFHTDIDYIPTANKLDEQKPKVADLVFAGPLLRQDSIAEMQTNRNNQMVNNQPMINSNNINTVPVTVVNDDPLESLRASTYGATNRHGFINNNNTQVINGGGFNNTPTLEQSLMLNSIQPVSPFNAYGNNAVGGLNVTGGGLNIGGNTGW